MLLTGSGALPQPTASYLDSLKDSLTHGVVLGGTSAVSSAAEAQFASYLGRRAR